MQANNTCCSFCFLCPGFCTVQASNLPRYCPTVGRGGAWCGIYLLVDGGWEAKEALSAACSIIGLATRSEDGKAPLEPLESSWKASCGLWSWNRSGLLVVAVRTTAEKRTASTMWKMKHIEVACPLLFDWHMPESLQKIMPLATLGGWPCFVFFFQRMFVPTGVKPNVCWCYVKGGGVGLGWGENIVSVFTTSNLRFHSIVIGFITLSSISHVIKMGWGGGGVVMEWGCGCRAENIVIDFTTSNLRFHSIVIGFIALSSISRVIRGWQWRWENTTCTNLCKKLRKSTWDRTHESWGQPGTKTATDFALALGFRQIRL